MLIDIIGIVEDGSPRGANIPVSSARAITLVIGSSFIVRLRAYYAGGAPFSVGDVNRTFALTVKRRPQQYDESVVLLTGTADATQGPNVVTFTGTPATTRNVTAGKYVWDVWTTLTDGHGAVLSRDQLVAVGQCTLSPTVTSIP